MIFFPSDRLRFPKGGPKYSFVDPGAPDLVCLKDFFAKGQLRFASGGEPPCFFLVFFPLGLRPAQNPLELLGVLNLFTSGLGGLPTRFTDLSGGILFLLGFFSG